MHSLLDQKGVLHAGWSQALHLAAAAADVHVVAAYQAAAVLQLGHLSTRKQALRQGRVTTYCSFNIHKHML